MLEGVSHAREKRSANGTICAIIYSICKPCREPSEAMVMDMLLSAYRMSDFASNPDGARVYLWCRPIRRCSDFKRQNTEQIASIADYFLHLSFLCGIIFTSQATPAFFLKFKDE